MPTLARKVAARWVLASLRPSVVQTAHYEIRGREVPTFFHAGKAVVKDIKDRLFDGWYGWGFYAAFDPDYVRRWYGPRVTRLTAKPNARVLVASVTAEAAPPGLFDFVCESELKHSLKGDTSKLQEFQGFILENPIQWVHAVDRLAIEEGYDLVLFSDEQIVVKPTTNPVIIEGEEVDARSS
jgi:hypothetical protein